MDFETTNENYNKILAKYISYLELYKIMNNGSLDNATPFEKFYWEVLYFGEYRDANQISRLGG